MDLYHGQSTIYVQRLTGDVGSLVAGQIDHTGGHVLDMDFFVDNDFDGKLSPGDKFEVHPGESGSDLENTNSVDDYKFRLKFEPTGDTIGYDTPLS